VLAGQRKVERRGIAKVGGQRLHDAARRRGHRPALGQVPAHVHVRLHAVGVPHGQPDMPRVAAAHQRVGAIVDGHFEEREAEQWPGDVRRDALRQRAAGQMRLREAAQVGGRLGERHRAAAPRQHLLGEARRPRGKILDGGGDGGAQVAEIPQIQRDGLDAVTDGFHPAWRDGRRAVQDAVQRPDRGAGAVGVLAAVHGGAHGVPEIPFPVQEPEHDDADVRRRIPPARPVKEALLEIARRDGVRAAKEGPTAKAGEQGVARLERGAPRLVGGNHAAHGPCHAALCGDVGQRDVDEAQDVPLDERRALQRRAKELAVSALAVAVVDDGVVAGHGRGDLRAPRRHASPDLRADERPARVLVGVPPGAGKRRQQPAAQVGLRRPVFGPVRGDEQRPVLAERVRIDVDALLLHGDEPQELDVQVVVRQRLAGQVARVKGDVVHLAAPLERLAQRAPDVLAQPAAEHPIQILRAVQVHERASLWPVRWCTRALYRASGRSSAKV